ncbi:F420-dependent oxidoreductase [Lentzea sp. NBRC 105346]|uniref:LLM class flavin-dependent oxidoreductase n=1 Tax=Lentzea sp. NBRC 105346 TaxID=3032205 RepID=UPI0024A5CE4A|nr:LLM class flavin-dependent oxidoreductase [Lentzea sp. NBRC 105346]GLZ29661.1 F420-dependent oxidoreductase [Lentzea sp. NBRC 105346]
MRIGVNIPNFDTDPGRLRDQAQAVEGLGFDLLMMSDHVVVTPDVAAQYPAPFYEPFTTLAYVAGMTERIQLGTTVLIVPYRHPLLTARMAANLNDLSGGRLVLGVGVGWARQEFEALGIPFERRGRITDDHLGEIRKAWQDEGYRAGHIPIWVGGNSDAAIARARRIGDAWHPLHFTMPWLEERLDGGPFVPRIKLRLNGKREQAGEGTIEEVLDDLNELGRLGAETVVLDPVDFSDIETIAEHLGRKS